MVKTASLFSQLLRHVPRSEFASLVGKHRAERYAKGFDSWTHFVAMLFAQVSGAESGRDQGRFGVQSRPDPARADPLLRRRHVVEPAHVHAQLLEGVRVQIDHVA